MNYILFLFCSLVCSTACAQTTDSLQHTNQESLHGVTLEQCLSLARQHSLELQNAALDIVAAREQESEAFTKYFPQITANVMAFRMFDKMVKQDGTIPQEIGALGEQFYPYIGQPYSIREFNSAYSITATAMQPLYTGGQITIGNKLARLQHDVTVLQQDLKERNVQQKVTEHYWQIAQLKYSKRTLDAADRQLETINDYVGQCVKAGLTMRNDLLKVKLHRQQLAANRIKLCNAERVLLMLLAQEIGQVEHLGSFDIALPEEMDGPTSTVTRKAQGDYPTSGTAALQYELALKGIEAQQLQLRMERAKLMPTVALGVMGYHTRLGGLSDNARRFIDNKMSNGLVLGTVSIPVSDWWGGSHAVKRQKAKLQQAHNTAQDAREKLLVDIEASWANADEAYQLIGVQQASTEQAAENLRIATEEYKAGTSTITDLLDAETISRQAQDNLSSAIAVYQIRLAEYLSKTE